MFFRFLVLGFFWLSCFSVFPALAQNRSVVLTDILGRKVELSKPAQRLVLGQGRQIVALSLLDPDPVKYVAGWMGEFRSNDRSTYELYHRKFPAIDAIPRVGASGDNTFSVEQALALKPDLVVLGIGQVQAGSDIIRQLDAGGIPVIVTDFFVDPFDNTLPSVRVLGEAIGRGGRAKEFADFYNMHMQRIAERLAQAKTSRPRLLFEAHAGMAECCFAPGRGNIGRFIEFAGGHNIAADVIPGANGQLSKEYIIAQDPPIYIATGGSHLDRRGGLVIGPGYSAGEIRERLGKLIKRSTISGLAAVRDGRVHGLFHNLITTPLNILATENLAKWIHPKLFEDLDPARTMDELNRRFLAVSLEGIYWIDFQPAKP